MKIIVGSPSTGKTRKMLELSAQNNVPILCENKQRADRLLEKAQGYGIRIPLPLCLECFDPNKDKEVYIDEVEFILEKLLHAKVPACSVKVEEKDDLINLDK